VKRVTITVVPDEKGLAPYLMHPRSRMHCSTVDMGNTAVFNDVYEKITA
jgi:hypothetical protein